MAIGAAALAAILKELTGAAKALDEIGIGLEEPMLRAFVTAELKMYARFLELAQTLPDDLRGLSASRRITWLDETIPSLRGDPALFEMRQAFTRYVTGYSRLAEGVAELLAAGQLPLEFVRPLEGLLSYMRSQDISYFDGLTGRAQERLDRALFDSLFGNVRSQAFVSDIKSAITGSYKWGKTRGLYEWHAGTYVRTRHAQVSRALVEDRAQAAGLEHRIYVGPVDSKMRPFCQALIGSVLTVIEIEELDNGQTASVLIDGGGFNCRHMWAAVTAEMGEAFLAEMAA